MVKEELDALFNKIRQECIALARMMGIPAQFRKLTAATTEVYGTSEDINLMPAARNEGHRGERRLARPVASEA